MKSNLSFFAIVILSCCYNLPQSARACDQVPEGELLRVRLSQPVSSYSAKPGMSVRGYVIESPQCDGMPAFPNGTLVEGHIASVHKVGMGFRHEVATLEIQFDRIVPRDDPPVEMRTRVLEVDNAREKVKDGVIHGIRSTNTPQNHILGSRLSYLVMWSPNSLWVLPAYRALFPFLPDPELYLPPGSDLLVQLTTPLLISNSEHLAPENAEFEEADRDDLDQKVQALPERTTTLDGADADVINLAFIGSLDQVETAFEAAGWKSSDAMSTRTAFREARAFFTLGNYARGPMSKQLLDGRPSDFLWQKGFNSLARRDHLRIWNDPEIWQGQQVWVSSATHDIGLTLSVTKAKFVHHVAASIDEEREKIVRDLTLAGCVETVHNAPRADMPRFMENAAGDELRTDGAVAIVQLGDCVPPQFKNDLRYSPVATRPRSRVARYFRTQVLSFRDIWRENVVYSTFALGRVIVHSVRSNHSGNNREIYASSTIDSGTTLNDSN